MAAARRFTKSTVDWAALLERVPSTQKNNLVAFRGRSENYMRKLNAYPEQAPKINWEMYKRTISVPAFVDSMKKQYEAVKIPYPSDNYSQLVDAQEKEAEQETAKFIAESNNRIKEYESELAIWNDMVPFEQMTEEDFMDAFPQLAVNPEKPTTYPHEPEYQPGYVDKELAAESH